MRVIFTSFCFTATFLATGFVSLCQAAPRPTPTAAPIQFTRSLNASTAKSGDVVTARTMQDVVLPNGQTIAKGAVVTGHIVDAHAYAFAPSRNAVQKASNLSLHLDSIVVGGATLPLAATVRAIADASTTLEASSVRYQLDTPIDPTRAQIGDASYSVVSESLVSSKGDVVGYHQKNGTFARLIQNDAAHNASQACGASVTEQSIAVFSPEACGLYGFGSRASLPENGKDADGTFTIETVGYTARMDAGSSALLEIRLANPQTASLASMK